MNITLKLPQMWNLPNLVNAKNHTLWTKGKSLYVECLKVDIMELPHK